MALIALSPSGNNYTRADGGANTTMPTGDYTVCMWVRRIGAYSARTTLMLVDGAAANADSTLGTTNAGLLSIVMNAVVVISGGAVTADVWKFVAFTHASTTFEIWLGDLTTPVASQGSNTNAYNSPGDRIFIFSDNFNGFVWNGAIAFPRMWNVALTSVELEAERLSTTLVKTANRWANWDFSAPTATIIDGGASVRTITRNGAISRTEDPFIAPVTSARIDPRAFPKPAMVQPLLSGRLL